MGIRFTDTVKLNQMFKDLEREIRVVKWSCAVNKSELKKVNNHLDVVDAIFDAVDGQGEELPILTGWAHVEDISEEDRYPLVNSDEHGTEIDTQVFLKKLDII